MESYSQINITETLIKMIDTRFHSESSWINIGEIIYNIYNGNKIGLNVWIESTRSALSRIETIPNYAVDLETYSKEKYEGFIKTNKTIRSLGWYAREDSYILYKEWHDKWCLSMIEKALSYLHTDVANAIYSMFWLDLIYCHDGKGTWFHYKNNIWLSDVNVKSLISGKFISKLQDLKYRKGFISIDSQKYIGKIDTLIKKLNTVSYTTNVVKELKEFFWDENLDTSYIIIDNVESYQKGIYSMFVSDTIETDDNSRITVNDMYSAFKVWFSENFQHKIPDLTVMIRGVSKEIGDLRNGSWHNISLRK